MMYQPSSEVLLAIGKKVAKIRQENGLSQSELAEKLGYSDFQSVSRLERGISDIPITKLYKVAEVLKVDVSTLLDTKQTITHYPGVAEDAPRYVSKDFEKRLAALEQELQQILKR